jgi:3-hydroxyisobutyrate dehydrogenase-like beta-hydroxyacid dehydrogenase
MSETTGAARETVGFIGLGVMGAPMARNPAGGGI